MNSFTYWGGGGGTEKTYNIILTTFCLIKLVNRNLTQTPLNKQGTDRYLWGIRYQFGVKEVFHSVLLYIVGDSNKYRGTKLFTYSLTHSLTPNFISTQWERNHDGTSISICYKQWKKYLLLHEVFVFTGIIYLHW